jgi:hypothetical protein
MPEATLPETPALDDLDDADAHAGEEVDDPHEPAEGVD